MKKRKGFGLVGILAILALGILLNLSIGCAPTPQKGTYHFDWKVHVMDRETLPRPYTTMTNYTRAKDGDEWYIVAESWCFDLQDMPGEMDLMMEGGTDHFGPIMTWKNGKWKELE